MTLIIIDIYFVIDVLIRILV